MSPPLAVLATLLLILVTPRRVPAWITFGCAGILLPVLTGAGLERSASLWWGAASSLKTLEFTGVCAGVFLLSSILTHGGHLSALCDIASAVVPSRRIRAAMMPALVGLVPMPGGAVVSAPLIDRAIGEASVAPADKNLINYWFRHVWELSWPLYPAVAAAAALAQPPDRFLLWQAALTAVMILAGAIALLPAVPAGAGSRAPMPSPWTLRAAAPIAVLVVVPLAGSPLAWPEGLGEARAVVAMALVAALVTTIRLSGLLRVPLDPRIYAMTILAWLIQVYAALVFATGAGDAIFEGLEGLPRWIPLVVVPFALGFGTGGTLPFVAVGFPLVLSGNSLDGPAPSALVLAYAAGFLGYLTSPVHMCLVLSTRYFNSTVVAAYRRLAIPLLGFAAAAVASFLVLGGRFSP